ncbi:efflux RND transporter periplasmic adaptor subunit [Gemmata sp. G18]|uniref:Efflux RND transporter periplasmic adaptor subunit n=1 Tax=Gemmata palustris TaxID=2822762 RepID=A0ABS5BKA6_9BACT|nr:efflux RND transporter periplasmic adaptor subunit [Gemmata palustris]MBP3954128.1 efflux RND transporter periplasmic adaptor subunit [Gemmata palustris]
MASSESFERPGALRWFSSIASAVPALVVLALLGGVAWWGHHSGWTLPKRAALAGEKKEADDWCAEHSVPESACVECNAKLAPKPPSFGWCEKHGVHDCPWCHPEVAQLRGSVPTVTADDLARAKRALDFTERPENSPRCKLHARRIQFESSEAVDKAGVGVDVVSADAVVESVSAPGEIGYDQTRVAHLSTRAPGTVFRVFKRIGEPVKAGELLALVEAGDVGKAKADLRQALAAVDSKSQTLANLKASTGVVTDARVREAEATLREARIRMNAARQALVNLGLTIDEAEVTNATDEQLERKLHFLGLPASTTQSLDPRTTTSNLLPMFAPMGGVITSGDVVAGEVVDVARVLFEVVDTSRLWVTLDVTAEQTRRVKLGQSVRFKTDGGKEEAVGTVVWRSTQADPKTRTVKVRADLHDPTGRFLANTFGTGRIVLREEPKAVVVPNAAIQWDGNCFVVFVQDKDFRKPNAFKLFHVRSVRIGVKSDTQTEIIAGLLPGEVIVTKNAEVLRGELFRSNIGDGCGCGH